MTTVKNRLHASRKYLKERLIEMVDKTLKSFPLRDDFADIVVRKAASQDDLGRAARLLTWQAKHKPEQFAGVQEAEKAGLYVVGKRGKVEGAGYFDEIVFPIGAFPLRAVRPREMGGEAEGVPDPAFLKSFRACFKLAKEKGISLAVVHGSQFDHAFCGFVPCFYYAVASLPCEKAKTLAPRATLREARDRKEEKAGEDALMRDPYATRFAAFLGGGPMHVVEQDGAPVGYLRVDPNAHVAARKYGMPHGHVSFITLKTREAALAVIKLAGERTEKAGDKELCVLQSHMTLLTQMILGLGGTYLFRPSCDVVGLDAEMAAIIDLAGLTREMHPEFQSRLNISPAHDASGGFSLEMGGATVGFAVCDGRVEIVAEKQNPHRILPRWVVTRLYTGYYSGEDVLTMGPLPFDRSNGRTLDDRRLDMKELRLPETEAAIFKALFPKLWPCAMPDPDVWPWVIGKPHPRYQGEARKTAQMKARIDALRWPWFGF